jgi:hypothetical protein
MVNSSDNEVSVNPTINGIYTTLPIKGDTSSSYLLHKIYYNRTAIGG